MGADRAQAPPHQTTPFHTPPATVTLTDRNTAHTTENENTTTTTETCTPHLFSFFFSSFLPKSTKRNTPGRTCVFHYCSKKISQPKTRHHLNLGRTFLRSKKKKVALEPEIAERRVASFPASVLSAFNKSPATTRKEERNEMRRPSSSQCLLV